jgi:hypothetical protein
MAVLASEPSGQDSSTQVFSEFNELLGTAPPGRVKIVLNHGVVLAREATNALSQATDIFQALYPQIRFHLLVLTSSQMQAVQADTAAAAGEAHDGEVFAYAIQSEDKVLGSNFIVFSEAAFDSGLSVELAEFFTPAASTVPPEVALFAHEFGHLLDSAVKGTPLGSNSLRLDEYAPTSEYARRRGVRETFAEAFAEFTLTGGKTKDPLALALAADEGWRPARLQHLALGREL